MPFTVDYIRVNDGTVLIEVFDIFTQTAFVIEGMMSALFLFFALIAEFQADALVQKGKLTQTVTQCVMIIDRCFSKDDGVRLEADQRSMFLRITVTDYL